MPKRKVKEFYWTHNEQGRKIKVQIDNSFQLPRPDNFHQLASDGQPAFQINDQFPHSILGSDLHGKLKLFSFVNA